jgi:D-alanine-D-alanine ligase-like ATP-grasp enzyme
MQSPYKPGQWKRLIPTIDSIIAKLEQVPILSVGITPYTRIVPAFFLKKYSIYTIKRSSDVDVMETFLPMHVLEDRYPAIAKKVHGTGYLIGNHVFQSFLKSRRPVPKLLFYTMTEKIVADLDRLGLSWIGNNPKTFVSVGTKGPFRELVAQLGLPTIPRETVTREDFLASAFAEVWERAGGPFVIQRADKETGGNEGTFFVHTEPDFAQCVAALSQDTSFKELTISPFIDGHSTSMLGCVMEQGVLSGPLQLQFIDVPQALHGVNANGIFFGNDLGFTDWDTSIEQDAQLVIEKIGEHLKTEGFKGIFGIDFLYDKHRKQIFANECNPRFTGSLVLYSLMLLNEHVPPMEFFHLLAHLDSEAEFDFDTVNAALKTRTPCAHIAFSPKGITSMETLLVAGVYEYDREAEEPLVYIGAGISLADLKNDRQFLLIDTVPSMGSAIEQQVPRLFKFIFPRSIAKSSYEIDGTAGYLVERFATVLLEAAQKKNLPE